MFQKGLSYTGVYLIKILSRLPLGFLYIIADVFYVLIYYGFGYRKQVVRQNLLHSFPEKTTAELLAIEKKFFRYLADLIVEIVKADSISESELKRRVRFKNVDRVESYLKNKESVLLCASHNGNYEWVCMAIGMNFSGQHNPIYKPLSNEVFDKWFFNMRQRFGNQMVAMRQTIRSIQSSKDQVTLFTFGSDQAPAKDESRYWTTLLNQAAAVQLGVEKIARKTNRPVFYLKTSYVKRGYYEVDCVPLCLDPAATAEFEVTELHTRMLENMLIEEPAFWLWSHRRWKHQPELQPDTQMAFS